ncbi:type I polyketide synthase [Nocardiopsis sp. EMB25]|nr:type I polyketide synthase [Nocardiopsis sp. EMB25]
MYAEGPWRGARHVDLPGYAFQHRRHWLAPGRKAHDTDGWRYRVSWERPPSPGDVGARRWLVVYPEGGRGERLLADAERALTEVGAEVVGLPVDATAVDQAFLAERLRAFAEAARRCGAAPEAEAGVLSLLSADDRPHPGFAGVPAGVLATLSLTRAAADGPVRVRLWCLSLGAVAVTDPERPDPAGAALWGLGRVAALEHPDLWGGLVDLPAEPDPADWRAAAARLGGPEDQIAVRDATGWGRRLTRARRSEAAGRSGYRPRGTVLVTGGLGALGARVARRLAAAGAEHLVLTGRRGPDAPGAAALEAELLALGVKVTITACDAADRAGLARVLAEVPADSPLTAVFHAAGLPQVTPLARTGPDHFAEVYAGKAEGAAVLDELTRPLELDAFVLFASGAGVWGSAGQGAYAAANAALDAVARRRAADGLPATSIAWGVWGGGGMGADEEGAEYLRRRGMRPLDPESALDLLFAAIASDETCLTVTDTDWPVFGEAFTALRPSPLVAGLVRGRSSDGGRAERAPAEEPTGAGAGEGAPAAALTGLAPEALRATLRDLVRERAAAVLGLADPAEVSPDGRFLEMGFDSLATVRLRRALTAATGVELSTGLLFDKDRPAELAEHLADLVEAARSPGGPPGVGGSEGSFAALYREAARTGRVAEAVDLLAEASRFRPSFATAAEQPVTPVWLGSPRDEPESALPLLVGCAGTAAVSGPAEFAALARALEGSADGAGRGGGMVALPQPGFLPGESVPSGLSAVLAAQAEALADRAGDRPFVLIGHSAGANMAHALARYLEERGRGPLGLVLADVYTPAEPGAMGVWRDRIVEWATRRSDVPLEENRLTAMGAYHRLLLDWVPEPTRAPVLHLRASEPMDRWPGGGDGWRSRWEWAHTTVDVPGNHFTMMAEHAPATARVVRGWLADLARPEPGRVSGPTRRRGERKNP